MEKILSLILKIVSEYPSRTMEFMQTKGAEQYVKTVYGFHQFAVFVVKVIIFCIFLIVSFVMLHVALLLYVPTTAAQRFWIAIGLTTVDLTVVGLILHNVLNEKAWVRMFGVDQILDEILDKKCETYKRRHI